VLVINTRDFIPADTLWRMKEENILRECVFVTTFYFIGLLRAFEKFYSGDDIHEEGKSH